MSKAMEVATELRGLARRRIWTVTESALILASAVAFPFLLAGSDFTTQAPVIVLALVTFAVISTAWFRRFATLVRASCPICQNWFFVSYERFMWSLPYLHTTCAHSGLHLSDKRHRGTGS